MAPGRGSMVDKGRRERPAWLSDIVTATISSSKGEDTGTSEETRTYEEARTSEETGANKETCEDLRAGERSSH